MKVRILRRKDIDSKPYWESFDYEGPDDISVAGLLDYLNYHDGIMNDQGEKPDMIAWDCSCLEAVCGACAMVINEVPALACETFLKDLKGDELVLKPLGKFPQVRDLIVDRSLIYENLKRTEIYIGEYRPRKKESHHHQYDAAKCLKCGMCLEICPNYTSGLSFFGAVFANDCYLVYARNRERSRNIRKSYAKHFGNSCSKSLSCMDVCPMNIPTIASMAKLNR